SNPAVALPGGKGQKKIVKPGGFGPHPWLQREAEDLAQETWAKVAQKIDQFDAARGTFFGFLKFWGGLVLLHYYARIRARLFFEALLSEIRSFYPEIEEEREILDLIAETNWDDEPKDPLSECVREIFHIAYGGDVPTHQSVAWSFVDVLHW